MKMHERLRSVFLSVLLAASAVPAQEQAPPRFNVWSPDSLRPYSKEMATEAPDDPHRFAVRQLTDYPNDGYLLVHREGDGQVEWHETQADVFFVQSGSAVLLLGGKLVDGETVGPHEKRNGQIVGGLRRPMTVGDVVRIPPRVPHQVLLNGSKSFDYFVIKIKGY
jgi:mannose-6-phosphate isomerase-like protein (cupin superfamily)